jgi:hypothetical protein
MVDNDEMRAGLDDVVDDVNGQRYGSVARDGGEEIAESESFLGVESGRGFIGDQQAGSLRMASAIPARRFMSPE